MATPSTSRRERRGAAEPTGASGASRSRATSARRPRGQGRHRAGCGTAYVSARHGIDNSPPARDRRLQADRVPAPARLAEWSPSRSQLRSASPSTGRHLGRSIPMDPRGRAARPEGAHLPRQQRAARPSPTRPRRRPIGSPAPVRHAFEWADEDSVEFHSSHGDMIRLLRESGSGSVEIQPPRRRGEHRDHRMGRRWPSEEVWKARKR